MAKLAGAKTISISQMSQEINLKRYFGRDASDAEMKTFAELAVEYINNRTLDGHELGGTKSFTPYTKEYADKKGVTRGSVDLFDDGDLLNSIDAGAGDGNNVRIELEGELETKIGFNHHTGDTLPARPWFGLTREEAKLLADKSKGKDPENSTTTLAELKDAIASLGIEVV